MFLNIKHNKTKIIIIDNRNKQRAADYVNHDYKLNHTELQNEFHHINSQYM